MGLQLSKHSVLCLREKSCWCCGGVSINFSKSTRTRTGTRKQVFPLAHRQVVGVTVKRVQGL